MFTVSLIGPDGVGKTTIVARLQKSLPMPVKYIYMGDNIESCNYMLPTMRWWKQRNPASGHNGKHSQIEAKFHKSGSQTPAQPNRIRRVLRAVKKTAGFVNRILDVWYRYFMVFYFSRKGYVVLLDRHFTFDYYHFDIAPENGKPSFKRRLNGLILKHTIPDPDLVICLDAPADVIFKRKGEFSVEYLEMRRRQYRSLQSIAKHFALVDANRKLETVIGDVKNLICDFQAKAAKPQTEKT
ncbi:MAG: hypothetical protein ACE5IR_08675 [bacterium]